VIRHNNGSVEFILIQQGVTQGDMMHLTHQLMAEFPEVEQPWYDDDSAAAAEFAIIRAMFERLLELGHGCGYQLESSKSILVVGRHNLERANVYIADLAFKVQTGSRYIYVGGFIGEDEDRDEWLECKVATRVDSIKQISMVMGTYP
jgi:hypothetical protein